jgi:error-prone DNA polymerase
VPIFQEQAMAIAMALGGFSAAEADELRRAMGHIRKLPKLHAALERLKSACVARGVAAAIAQEVVDDLHSFANYGFPESHAWSFALIAYATAYLKANYPTEFFLGMLNAWPMGFYPPATLVHDARRHGVVVRPPCLKVGAWECTIEPVVGPQATSAPALPPADPAVAWEPALRIGWKHIRGLGATTRDALLRAHAEGPFTSIEDVVRRARLTRPDALHLARAGALEAFAPGRRRAAWEALRVAGDLLPLAPAARVLPFEPRELAGEERIFLDYLATGICTDGHPMEHLRARLADAGVASSRDLERYGSGERILVGGLVVARQHPATAKGTVFVLLEDEFGYINIIVPRTLFQQNREVVTHSPFLLIEGRFERDDRVLNVVGSRFRELRVGGRRPARERVNYRARDFH